MDPITFSQLALPHGVVIPDQFIHLTWTCPHCDDSTVINPSQLDDSTPICAENTDCPNHNEPMEYSHTVFIICPKSLAIIKASSLLPCDN
jgi:hypothetical protein